MVRRRGFVVGLCRRFPWCFISVLGFGVLFFNSANARATTGQEGELNALRSARGLCMIRRSGQAWLARGMLGKVCGLVVVSVFQVHS